MRQLNRPHPSYLRRFPPLQHQVFLTPLHRRTFHPHPLSTNTCNYLAILTLAWTYVLSSYWAEIQGGVTQYTTSRAPILATKQTTRSWHSLHYIYLRRLESKRGSGGVPFLPRPGWRSQIQRHGREWISPWSLSVNNTKFAIVSDLFVH